MKLKMPAKDDVEIDMAPMIDMVFLLLIFFMVASVVPEIGKKTVIIPKAKYGKVAPELKDRMTISVDENGKIYDGLVEITLADLKVRVADELDKNPNLRIMIRADERVQYKHNKEIMMACASVGALDIIYATFEE